MKFIMKKITFLFIAIVLTSMFFCDRSYAVSISLELSGDGIQNANGTYLYTKMIPVGETLNLKAEMVTRNDMHVEGIPIGEINREDVSTKAQWSSSKENVATVKNGVITGVAEGITDIIVTYDNQSIKFEVAVGEDNEVGFGENIYIVQKDERKTIKKGETLQLDINGVETLSNIENKDVEWTSSNEKIAKVDLNGLVTGTGVGKVTIKAEYVTDRKTYDSTYEINVQDESNDEPPMDIIDDTYDFFSNKKKIEINVGSSDKVEITAKLKDGLVVIDVVEMVKDNWDVEWKIEDETIAKCVVEKGIENNKYGGKQIAGRATIQGLKGGTTKLLIKVKVSTSRIEEFEIPITINEFEKHDEKKEDKKEDNTVVDKKIPDTGENNLMIRITLGITVIALAYLGIKLKNKF